MVKIRRAKGTQRGEVSLLSNTRNILASRNHRGRQNIIQTPQGKYERLRGERMAAEADRAGKNLQALAPLVQAREGMRINLEPLTRNSNLTGSRNAAAAL